MTHLRLILLTTTAIAAVQSTHMPAQAESASLSPIVVAQAPDPNAPKGPPPKAAPPPPPKAAPAPPPPPPPRAAPPPPPQRAAPPPPPPQRAAPPPPPPPPKAAPVQPPAPPKAPPPPPVAPPKAAPATPPAPPTPPAVQRTAPPPPPAATTTPPSSAAPPPPAAAPNAPPVAPGVRDVTPPRPPADGERRGGQDGDRRGPPPPALNPNGTTPTSPSSPPPAGATPPATPGAATSTPPATPPGGTPPAGGTGRDGQRGDGQRGDGPRGDAPRGDGPRTGDGARAPNVSPPAMQTQRPPAVTAPLPTLQTVAPSATPPAPIAPNASIQTRGNVEDVRGQRREQNIGGRTVISEPGRIIIRDPGGQSYVRHNEVDRFRLGARDVRVQQDGNNQRTVVVRPDGTQIITINDREGRLQRRLRRGPDGREIIIIDNTRRGPVGIGGFFVSLPPPIIRIPRERYIVDYYDAPPQLIYDTLYAPPVERIERPYSLDEIRYSPSVRERMPSIDIDTINFETGSWEIPPDQAESLRVIAEGMNQAIQRNPRTVFLIEGHTDAVGNDTDNLSLSDRRAESAAALLTQQFGVPPENLTSQGYGEQYLKVPTNGPERRNRRVTIRNITPLLNGGQASLPPPPPGVGPGGR